MPPSKLHGVMGSGLAKQIKRDSKRHIQSTRHFVKQMLTKRYYLVKHK